MGGGILSLIVELCASKSQCGQGDIIIKYREGTDKPAIGHGKAAGQARARGTAAKAFHKSYNFLFTSHAYKGWLN